MLTSDTPRKEPDCCKGTTYGLAYKADAALVEAPVTSFPPH